MFLENPALSHTTSYWFLAPCQNLEKVNDTIQRKDPDRQMERQTEGLMEGRMDRETLFYRTLPATAGGPIKQTSLSSTPMLFKVVCCFLSKSK